MRTASLKIYHPSLPSSPGPICILTSSPFHNCPHPRIDEIWPSATPPPPLSSSASLENILAKNFPQNVCGAGGGHPNFSFNFFLSSCEMYTSGRFERWKNGISSVSFFFLPPSSSYFYFVTGEARWRDIGRASLWRRRRFPPPSLYNIFRRPAALRHGTSGECGTDSPPPTPLFYSLFFSSGYTTYICLKLDDKTSNEFLITSALFNKLFYFEKKKRRNWKLNFNIVFTQDLWKINYFRAIRSLYFTRDLNFHYLRVESL